MVSEGGTGNLLMRQTVDKRQSIIQNRQAFSCFEVKRPASNSG